MPGRANLQTPPETRQRYGHLYRERVRETDDGGLAFHRGRRWDRRGIHVLSLAGDRFEMAFQHGRLLRDEIADGSLEQASKITPNAIRNSVGDGLLARLVERGWLNEEQALSLAADWLYNNPNRFFKLGLDEI